MLILDEPFGAVDAFTREDLWQAMHDVKARESFTGVLIKHDVRESGLIADPVVGLSARSARTQYVLDVPPDGKPAETAEMLHALRQQIEIAEARDRGTESSARSRRVRPRPACHACPAPD